jgi:hypothetical protein
VVTDHFRPEADLRLAIEQTDELAVHLTRIYELGMHEDDRVVATLLDVWTTEPEHS